MGVVNTIMRVISCQPKPSNWVAVFNYVQLLKPNSLLHDSLELKINTISRGLQVTINALHDIIKFAFSFILLVLVKPLPGSENQVLVTVEILPPELHLLQPDFPALLHPQPEHHHLVVLLHPQRQLPVQLHRPQTLRQPRLVSSPVVSFANILWANILLNSFRQKITNTNCQYIKASKSSFVQKSSL